jgi:hypothetical protein
MFVLVAFPNMNEILWLLERQWIEDYHFHYPEDGSGGADAERQRRDGHRCEAQASTRRSQGAAQILDEAFNEVWAASVVALLFGSLDCAKLCAGSPHRFGARNTAANQILGTGLNVETQLRAHLVLHARTPQDGVPPR